jgi:hypothetical protein
MYGFPGLLFNDWEVFSRLRFLKKPVELYVVPDYLEHGTHTLQNPGQVLAAHQRALDWWEFWLNGREDGVLSKREQYDQWRAMRRQQIGARSSASNSEYSAGQSASH